MTNKNYGINMERHSKTSMKLREQFFSYIEGVELDELNEIVCSFQQLEEVLLDAPQPHHQSQD